MSELQLQIPPVGIKVFFEKPEALQHVEVYRGNSYCDAVRRATGNEELLLISDSILTCQWSPVILGLKQPENSFERRLEPRMEKIWGYYLAPLSYFSGNDFAPDIVIIRDEPAVLKKFLSIMGWEKCALQLAGEIDKSALRILRNDNFSLKSFSTVTFNKLLANMGKRRWWYRFTEIIFQSSFVSDLFDRFISFFMADMSVCRNSTVIPYITGLVNASHFCSGGITWGLNYPGYLTAGVPYGDFKYIGNKLSLKWPATDNKNSSKSFLPQRDCGCSLIGNEEKAGQACRLNERNER